MEGRASRHFWHHSPYLWPSPAVGGCGWLWAFDSQPYSSFYFKELCSSEVVTTPMNVTCGPLESCSNDLTSQWGFQSQAFLAPHHRCKYGGSTVSSCRLSALVRDLVAVWLMSDVYGKENLTTPMKFHLYVCTSPFYVFCRHLRSTSDSVYIHFCWLLFSNALFIL